MGPFGEVLAVDRADTPREILSPAVSRGAFFSIHAAVTAEVNTSYFLAVQSYPAGIFQWKLYKESYAQHGKTWIPDALVERRPPYFEVMPEADVKIGGQNTQLYLLDVWVPEKTPSGTARLEILAKSDTWRVAPMEVRILPVTIPIVPVQLEKPKPLPGVELSADTPAAQALAAFLKGEKMWTPAAEPLNLRSAIYRNSLQDLALSRTLDIAVSERCWDARNNRKGMGAEWYLRVRDCLYRAAWKRPE